MRPAFLPWASSLLAAGSVVAGLPYAPTPDWVSSDVSMVSTGAALVDLDRDGWLDLVVANGNDIERQPLVVYYNRGDGTLPAFPDWSSSSWEYHGHLATGDVNQDGWPDVAVAVFLGPSGFSTKGWAALYLNDGAGGLPPTPSWISADTYFGFGVALGDADSDGDLDLAVAVGEPYFNSPDNNRLYINRDGALDTFPWLSLEEEHNLGVAFGDADNDGDLDLAFAGTGAPHRVYYQFGDAIDSISDWQSLGNAPITPRLAFGDLDRDGDVELVVAENNQLDSGSDGRLRVYSGTAAGLSVFPSWSSDYSGYGSEAVLADANGDGWLDLLGGSWGQSGSYSSPIRAFSNRYVRPLDTDPGWVSATGSVIERIVLGDVNNDGLDEGRAEFAGDGTRQLFQLPHVPFREITSIVADGIELGPEDYCTDPSAGWISLGEAPNNEIVINYMYSTRIDLAVANWDSGQGNFLFYAIEPVMLYADVGQTGTELLLYWTGGSAPFDVLESTDPRFGPGLELKSEGLAVSEWEDEPGSLHDGTLTFYLVY